MELIDKSAVKAEIKKRINDWTIRGKNSPIGQGKDTCESRVTELNDLLSFLNTLEVKEVQEEPVSNDLEEAATKYARKQLLNPDYPTYNDEYAHGGIILYGLDGRVPGESKDKINKQ